MHSEQYKKLISSARWQALRRQFLTDHPLCEACKAKGYVVAANTVHHIIEVESATTERDMIDLCFSPSNLQALCRGCHNELHAAKRSHSRKAHKERMKESLKRFIDKVSGHPPAHFRTGGG